MTIERVHVSKCWCGSERLTPFADRYLRCADCGTLVNSPRLPDGCFSVGDGERNFYNKDYWLAYQRERHGLPDIVSVPVTTSPTDASTGWTLSFGTNVHRDGRLRSAVPMAASWL